MDALSQAWNTYVTDLPRNWGKNAIVSFACGFAATTLLTANPYVGVMYGAFSAVASLIHSAITPLFKQLFGGGERVDMLEELLKSSISVIGAASLAHVYGFVEVMNSLWLWFIAHNLFLTGGALRQNSNRFFCFVRL